MNYLWLGTTSQSGLPPNTVYAGNDSDGSPIYVGRAFHEGENLPAKVIPSKQVAYVSHNGLEIPKYQFEVLSGSGFTWIASSNGHVPQGAVMTGNTVTGQPLYVGRTHHENSLTPGKVHPTHGCLYYPYGGAENSSLTYEVLVGQQGVEWRNTSVHAQIPAGAIVAGNDTDGSPIYVGRIHHEGELVPAKVIPSKQAAYISFNGQEILKHNVEYLCNANVSWVPSSGGQILPKAIAVGRTSSGEPLYVGRVHHNGSLTPGKVHPSHGNMYISYGGMEMAFRDYELLVEN